MRRSLLAGVVMLVALAVPSRLGAQANQDVDRAFAAVRAAATAGNPIAQFSLGALLYYGSPDTAEAIEWFRKAAAQQYAPAEFQLGQVYDFGFIVGQNDREALTWYRRAAEHGSAAAQRSVGDFHQKGRGVAADAAEAARWYRRAAEGDDIRAQYQLGEMYMAGTGVTRDYASAYLWFAIAAGQAPLIDNRKELIELRNIAAARMTPEETAAAARRVAMWKPSAAPIR